MADSLYNTAGNDEDVMDGRYMTFSIEKETYGIEIRHVVEIIGIQAFTGMPEMPDYIKGIINLRGSIIPVMDVRLRFKKQPREYDERTCIIIIDFGGFHVGLIVDSVYEVLAIPSEDIQVKPEINNKGSRGYVKNIGKVGEQIVLLIDCDKLLNEEELDVVSAQLGEKSQMD
jgi:purine-binding chemotaxis protein CheW